MLSEGTCKRCVSYTVSDCHQPQVPGEGTDGVIKSDYPWVKSFGPQADEDLNGFVRMLELDAGDHIAQARFEENRGQESMPKQL